MPLFPPQAFRKTEYTHRIGIEADKPSAADVLVGTLWFSTDTDVLQRSDGATWVPYSGVTIEATAWTPILTGSGGGAGVTYTQQTGSVIKIGNFVFANFFIILSSFGGIAGNVLIGDLPYFANAENGCPQVAVYLLATTWTSVYVVVDPATDTALVRGTKLASVNNVTSVVAADLLNTTVLAGGLIYQTDD